MVILKIMTISFLLLFNEFKINYRKLLFFGKQIPVKKISVILIVRFLKIQKRDMAFGYFNRNIAFY